MNRLQKKCYIVSAGFHGLLLVVILFGAALMPEPEDLSSFKPMTIYSPSSVSDALSQGGDPNAGSANAAPPAAPANPPPAPAPVPTSTPPPAPAPKPEPRPEPVKPKPEVAPAPKPEMRHESPKPRLDLTRVEPRKITRPKTPAPEEERAAPVKPPKFKIDLKELQKVNRSDTDQQAQAAEANRLARQRALARQQREVASALQSLKSGLSSGTLVQTTPGVGGGGEVSVNYGNIIFNRYYNAWIAPAMLEDDTPVVTVSVTIARSGQVISHHIVRSSGNKLMDRSVANALENVTYIAPFPDNSTDQERTVTIEFNLQAKKQTG